MTPQFDIFGQQVSLAKTGDLEAWNNMQLGFLAHAASTPQHLTACIESDPDFALPQICKGFFCLLLGRREMTQAALDAQQDASIALKNRPVTDREQLFFDALQHYNAGQPKAAADILQRRVGQDPSDALAVKLVQAIRFVLGDAVSMRASMESVMPHVDSSHAAYGYMLGCHAFTLEETGEYGAAERTGRLGLRFAKDDAWGLHAVAHVFDMTNNIEQGLDWLENRTAAWAHCNNFRYHVWWHLALMYLDRGDIDRVVALYDSDIRADKTDDYRDISNAASLLSRLELDGHNVGHRWEELAELSDARTGDGCLPFADLHYMLSLVGGKRHDAASRLIARMRLDAKAEASEMDAIFKHPGLSAAEGLEAFGEGQYTAAFRHLASARDAMQTIGGSHAQRDVFERLTIEAALRGGYFGAAQQFLEQRTQRRDGHIDRFAQSRLAELEVQRNIANGAQLMPAE